MNSVSEIRVKVQILTGTEGRDEYISYCGTGDTSGKKIVCIGAKLSGPAPLAGPLTGQHACGPQSLGTWNVFLFQSETHVSGGAEAECRPSMRLPQLIERCEGLSWKDRLIISAPSHHPGQIYGGRSMGAPDFMVL